MTFERQINDDNAVFGLIRTPSEPENVFLLRSYFPSPPPLLRSNNSDIIDIIAPFMNDQNELDELLELFRANRNEIEEEYEEEYEEDFDNHMGLIPSLITQNEREEILELFCANWNENEEEYDPYSHLSEEEYEEYLFDRRMTL
jgi:hypothetical protein